MNWKRYGWTENYVYWIGMDGDRPVYNVTGSCQQPPANDAGYYNLFTLRLYKNDSMTELKLY